MNLFSDAISGLTAPQLLIGKVVAYVLLVIALYAAWNAFTGHYVDIGRKEVQEKFDKHIKEDETAKLKRDNENIAKDNKSQQEQNSINSNHENEIKNIRAKYAKLETDKDRADASIDNWRDRVRIELAKAAIRLPDISSTTEEPAFNQSDRDTTTLREACEITTRDYNTLHDSWDKACLVYGCK